MGKSPSTRTRYVVRTRATAGVLLALALLTGWTWPAPHALTPPRLVLPRPLPHRTLIVPILMYHRIGREPIWPAITDALTVPAAVFAGEMLWLRAAGFHAITQRQLFEALEYGARLPRRPVLITFDDGYRDVLWNAAPLLHRLRMPATAYVITGRLSGPDSSFLTWGELGQLEADGITIGSHTVHHLELTLLPRVLALDELVDSRWQLAQHLHRRECWVAAATVAPRRLPTASLARGFFVSGGRCGTVRREDDRGEVAASLGGRAGVPRPGSRAGRRRAPLVPTRDASVPVRDPAHRSRPELHDG